MHTNVSLHSAVWLQNPLGTSNLWELLNVSLGMNSFCLSPAYSKGIVHSKHITQFRAVRLQVTVDLSVNSGLLRVLESPWKSLNFFPDFQGLGSPWKQTWFLKVLESVSEGPWKCLN